MAVYRAILLLLSAACAWGGVVYTFEPPTYAGSSPGTGGTPLGGQNGWVTPSGYGNAVVYTYLGTGLSVPSGGGSQFVAAGANDEDVIGVSFAGSSEWAITFDVLVHSFSGTNFSAGSF
jgi:hypothetical protein